MRCLNWKVLGVLGAIGVAVYVLAPGVAAAAVPLLVLAVCPLSMLVMMRAMGSTRRCEPAAGGTDASDELARLRAEVEALRAERKVR